MPIRADLRHHYGRDWQELSLRIRGQRAGWKCERCNAPHNETIARLDCGRTYMLRDGRLFCARTGDYLRDGSAAAYCAAERFTTIVLTTAHLDQNPANNAEDNLAALCQRCHLAHDQDQHRCSAVRTRRAQMATPDLFETDRAG